MSNSFEIKGKSLRWPPCSALDAKLCYLWHPFQGVWATILCSMGQVRAQKESGGFTSQRKEVHGNTGTAMINWATFGFYISEAACVKCMPAYRNFHTAATEELWWSQLINRICTASHKKNTEWETVNQQRNIYYLYRNCNYPNSRYTSTFRGDSSGKKAGKYSILFLLFWSVGFVCFFKVFLADIIFIYFILFIWERERTRGGGRCRGRGRSRFPAE